jgi:hypothetical protein
MLPAAYEWNRKVLGMRDKDGSTRAFSFNFETRKSCSKPASPGQADPRVSSSMPLDSE